MNTQNQMDQSTVTVMDEHQNGSVFSDLTNSMYVYIIPLTGIFIIFIVVSNILLILHRRKICPNSARRFHIKNRNKEFDRDAMSTHTSNQADTNNSQYETINFDSDDSESITCLTIDTSLKTSNQQPALSSSFISRSNLFVDPDGYQCPISSETREKTISRDASLNNYLTVV